MKTNKETIVNLVEDLIKITTTINNIYQNLNECEYYQQEEKYQETIELLKMALELENKIYNKLIPNKTNVLEKIKELKRIIHNLTIDSNSNLTSRILLYLLEKEHLNPFLSMASTTQQREFENIGIILTQYNLDSLLATLNLLDKNILKLKKNSLKKMLLNQKYQILFMYKNLESFINLGDKIIINKCSGRTRCILFNQDKDLISTLYQDSVQNMIEDNIQVILNKEEIFKGTNLTNEQINYYRVLNTEANLSLLTDEEFFVIYQDYYYSNMTTTDVSNCELKIIMDVLKKEQKRRRIRKLLSL